MQNRFNKHRNRVFCMLALAATTMLLVWSAANAQDDVKSVSDVLTQSAVGFEKGDMAALEKLWANDESVTVFESGHANYGWADYRDHHLGPEMKEMKNTKYTLSDIKVRVSGNTAWATFKYTISADIGTGHVDGAGLGTAVLEKRGQDWRIVHWHSSAPRRAPSPAASPSPRP
jgi:ketosteroid isomerase-like protein